MSISKQSGIESPSALLKSHSAAFAAGGAFICAVSVTERQQGILSQDAAGLRWERQEKDKKKRSCAAMCVWSEADAYRGRQFQLGGRDLECGAVPTMPALRGTSMHTTSRRTNQQPLKGCLHCSLPPAKLDSLPAHTRAPVSTLSLPAGRPISFEKYSVAPPQKPSCRHTTCGTRSTSSALTVGRETNAVGVSVQHELACRGCRGAVQRSVRCPLQACPALAKPCARQAGSCRTTYPSGRRQTPTGHPLQLGAGPGVHLGRPPGARCPRREQRRRERRRRQAQPTGSRQPRSPRTQVFAWRRVGSRRGRRSRQPDGEVPKCVCGMGREEASGAAS